MECMNSFTAEKSRESAVGHFIKDFFKYKFLFIMILPGILYYLVFCYGPMFGIIIAFKDYRISFGFSNSEWVGLKFFIKFLTNEQVYSYIVNTFLLNLYGLLWGFPMPIIFAIMLAEARSTVFRKVIQTVSFLPHFVSVVVTVSIIKMVFHINEGIINRIIAALGGERIDFLNSAKWFRTVFIGTGIWQNFGWDSIIYLAGIIGIDPQLYESAMLDGANTWQKTWHITLPGIMSTISIMLILSIGSLFSSGFDKVYLMQTGQNSVVSEVISTYVYKRGILASGGTYPEFSYTTAIGLSQSLVNVVLLLSANAMARKLTESSLF